MNFHRPKICRICRAPDNDDLISVRLIQDSISIARMVEVLTDIQVTLDKNLPQNICLQCLERVRSAYQLRLQCIESDKQFRNEIYSVKDVLKLSHDESKDMIKLEIEALDKDIEQEDEIFTTDPDEHSLSIVPEESNEKIDLKIIAEETEESFLVEESIVETEDSKLTAAQELIDILAPEEDNNRKSSLMYLSHYQEKDYEVLIESDHYDHVRFMSASCCGCSERFKDKTDLTQHGLIEHRRLTKVMSKPKKSSKMDFNALVEAIKRCSVDKRTTNSIAKAYSIPRTTLQGYLKKVEANFADVEKVDDGQLLTFVRECNQRVPSNQVFSIAQENYLVENILKYAMHHYGTSVEELRGLAYQFAVKLNIEVPDNWYADKKAGKYWYNKFMLRHPELALRISAKSSLDGAKAICKQNVELFFDHQTSPEILADLKKKAAERELKKMAIKAAKATTSDKRSNKRSEQSLPSSKAKPSPKRVKIASAKARTLTQHASVEGIFGT